MAFVKNTRTGKTTSVPNHYIGHPVLGGDLIVVGSQEQSAPIKEKKKKYSAFTVEETESPKEQNAPEINIENEEIEDGN